MLFYFNPAALRYNLEAEWRNRYPGGRTLDRDDLVELCKADILDRGRQSGCRWGTVHIIIDMKLPNLWYLSFLVTIMW